MLKHVRFALLPLVVALPFVVTPAEAISIGSGSAVAASPGAAAPSQALSKKQLKQQRKLAKQCAKFNAGKVKKASKRAKYAKLCAQSPVSTPPASAAGAGPDVEDEQDTTTPDADSGSNGAGAGSGSSAGGGGSNAGGGPGDDAPGQDYLDELLDLPPIFTPPQGGGDEESGEGSQAPVLDAVTPTNDVPEPGSLALLGLGLVGLGLARGRRAR